MRVTAVLWRHRAISSTHPAATQRLLPYEDNPLTQTLRDAWPPKWKAEERLLLRHEVVSESLCDDVIRYLAPTLEKHKGCTIIDINPGACLWSSKIHDFLKPRRHLLMEPNQNYLVPFINPLLEKPGSTYRYTPLSGADDFPRVTAENYKSVFSDPKLLGPLPRLSEVDPKKRELNPDFLVLGNLSRLVTRRQGRGWTTTFATSMLNVFSMAVLQNEMMHKYGLVRMLMWVPEAQKSAVIISSESSKHKTSFGMAIAMNPTEVAGCNELAVDKKLAASKKPSYMTASITERVQRSMKELGMRIPDDREANTSVHTSDQHVTYRSPLHQSSYSLAALQNAVQRIEKRFQRMEQWPSKGTRQVSDDEEAWALETLAFPQSLPSAQHYKSVTTRRGLVSRLAINIDMCLRFIQLEANLRYVGEIADTDANTLKAVESQIRDVEKSFWEKCIEGRSQQYREWVSEIILQQISFFSPSPAMLPRNCRLYDPIRVSPNEFWPKNANTLLDLTPTPHNLAIDGLATSAESARTLVDLLKLLFAGRTQNLVEALKVIGPDAAKELIPHCPTITDARKGGRLNPERMRLTMLTDDMIIELTKAFLEWPFRPELSHYISQMTSPGRPKRNKDQEEDFGDDDEMVFGSKLE